MTDWQKWGMGVLGIVLTTIIFAALIEAAKRRGLIARGPTEALADVLAPPAGTQIPPGGGA